MREMKDSGIEWIGEIPKDWCVKNGKYVFNVYGMSVNDDFINDTVEESYKIKYYKVDNLNEATEQFYVKSNFANFSIKIYEIKGPIILVPKRGGAIYTNKVRIEKEACLFDSNIMGLTTNNNVRFMAYVLYGRGLSDIGDVTTIPQINKKHIDVLKIPVPSINEQEVIVEYLDTKCSEIDATAEDIQKEISLLEDYKKSLVYNVISKGINHSRYSTENDEVWGNLPQGWKLVDIKYLFEIVKRIAGKEGYDVLSVTQKGLKIKDITSGDGQLADNYCGYQFVYPTDYVMNHMDLLTGWVDCSELFGVTSPDYRVFRLIDRSAHNLVYYKYVMQCCYMNKIFYSLGQGVSNLGRWRLQTSSFNNFKIPVPPKDEQDEIADFLDSKCSEIDSLIADKKRQLDILADYKKSLIYEYVTGKKEVATQE